MLLRQHSLCKYVVIEHCGWIFYHLIFTSLAQCSWCSLKSKFREHRCVYFSQLVKKSYCKNIHTCLNETHAWAGASLSRWTTVQCTQVNGLAIAKSTLYADKSYNKKHTYISHSLDASRAEALAPAAAALIATHGVPHCNNALSRQGWMQKSALLTYMHIL